MVACLSLCLSPGGLVSSARVYHAQRNAVNVRDPVWHMGADRSAGLYYDGDQGEAQAKELCEQRVR